MSAGEAGGILFLMAIGWASLVFWWNVVAFIRKPF
jgi:hypothetical protein